MTDKVQRSEVRTKGWMVHDILDDKKITYAAHDGMASYITGRHLWCAQENEKRIMQEFLQKQRKRKASSQVTRPKRRATTVTSKPKPFQSILCFDPAQGQDSIYSCMSSGNACMLPTPIVQNAGEPQRKYPDVQEHLRVFRTPGCEDFLDRLSVTEDKLFKHLIGHAKRWQCMMKALSLLHERPEMQKRVQLLLHSVASGSVTPLETYNYDSQCEVQLFT